MIKLPKFPSIPEKNNQSAGRSNLTETPKSKVKYEEIEWNVEDKRTSALIPAKVEKAPSKSVPLQELKMTTVGDNIPGQVNLTELNSHKTAPRNALRRIRFDHSYSNGNSGTTSVRCASVQDEYHSLDVNKLYYLNGEPSLELSSFMIHETLNHPVSEWGF